MADIFRKDFREFITAFNDAEVEYVLVGGYSVMLHGYSRPTGDLDIWVNKTSSNYDKLCKAFVLFGLPLLNMNLSKFLDNSVYDVFSFGRPPLAIDILTNLKGLDFDEAYKKSEMIEVDEIRVRLIHYNHLIEAKKAAGRTKDLNDIENLERIKDL